MLTESSIEIQMGELAQIVEYVFKTMVCLEVSESNQPWIPDKDRSDSDHPFGGRVERSAGAGMRPQRGLRIRGTLSFHGVLPRWSMTWCGTCSANCRT